ncbi:hypothetical protein SAMN05421678_102511 [Actinopolymorpha cephalotaxi]|uniref:Uncharacterized protein n=1 Tax=Actinopolymorpha cephalotaxi TaxID=504797 RepID=A0A1I2MB32_9ACTN|nr:hypothetical protein [Actinopolymorpha cephalotaxi]NYH81648.1 hypothetical protein [Actinopolymorpha cephalotaxi]SFF88120.1 hypothetical protein SAMN05421678_102511 [Actinopolymorpha cephalotaxi]
MQWYDGPTRPDRKPAPVSEPAPSPEGSRSGRDRSYAGSSPGGDPYAPRSFGDGTDADVAETGAPRRRLPRWVRFTLGVATALVLGWLALTRLTAPGAEVQVSRPRFVDNFTARVDVTVRSRIGDPQVVLPPQPPALPGLEFAGVNGLADPTAQGRAEWRSMQLPGHGRREFSLYWKVRDCAPALAAGDREVAAPLRVVDPGGARSTLRLSVGVQRGLLPSVCTSDPGAGRARLVDTGPVRSDGSRSLLLLVTVQNVGGRPLTYRDTVVAADPSMRVVSPSGDSAGPDAARPGQPRLVPVGEERAIPLDFRANDCRVPLDGAAEVTMRFSDGGASARQVALPVRLADSWENFLGVCAEV